MKFRSLLFFVLPCALFVLLLVQSGFTSDATLSRLLFFIRTVFPSLFVSLCLSGMIVSSPYTGVLYRFPFGVEITVFLLGVFCGFPVGARCALLLYEDGKISKRRAEFLCGFSNLASLPFLTGVVGGALFEDTAFGVHLALAQTVCAMITAFLLYCILRPDCGGVQMIGISAVPSPVQAVKSGTYAMLELGGMLVFFGVFADCLSNFLSLSGMPAVLLQGLLEFSSGCQAASAYGGEAGRLLCAVIIGTGGFCVFAQVASVTKGKLSLLPYLLGKLMLSALMALFALVMY